MMLRLTGGALLPNQEPVETHSDLRLFRSGIIILPCRFTNFIVKSAVKTARFSSARAIGRAPNARNAARPNSKRNSPPSHQPTREPAALRRQNVAAADAGRDAGVIELAKK